MRHLKYFFASVALLSAVSCSAVIVEEPIGLTPLQIERDDWEGYWVGHAADEEEAITGSIDVIDAENGVIRVTWIESDDAYTSRVYLLESDDWTFASIPIPEEGGFDFGLDEKIDPSDEAQYVWARIVKQDDAIYFWAPDVSKFRHLVSTGRIPARQDQDSPNDSGSDVLLGRLEPEHYEFLASDQAGIPFEWDQPFVLIRVAE